MTFDRADNQRWVHDANGKSAMAVRTFNSCLAGDWTRLDITYPTSTTEIYTFKDGADTVKVITLTYTDTTKSFLASVAR